MIKLSKYEIAITGDLNLKGAKIVGLTIDRGLYGTSHTALRQDVSALRHDLSATNSLTDSLRQRVVEVVQRFNALSKESLNKTLLDDPDLPMTGDSGATAPTLPQPQPNDQAQGNPWIRKSDLQQIEDGLSDHTRTLYGEDGQSGLVERVTALENRNGDNFSLKRFGLAVGIGAVLGLLLGFILAALEVAFGPVAGLFLGALAGAIVGYFVSNKRKPDTNTTTPNNS